MNTNGIELSMEELEQVNGGDIDLKKVGICSLAGAGLGTIFAGSIAAVLAGPVGLCMAGGAAIGGLSWGIYAACTDD